MNTLKRSPLIWLLWLNIAVLSLTGWHWAISGDPPTEGWSIIHERKATAGWLHGSATIQTERMNVPGGFILRTIAIGNSDNGALAVSMVFVPIDPNQKLEK